MQSPNDLEKVRSKLRLECASARRIHRAKVSRVDILTGFVDLYGCNPNLTENEIWIEFDGERGLDGGGLVREAYAIFWEAFEKEYLEGREQKVPVCFPRLVNGYFQIGRILSHGYVLTWYFPLCLSKPVVQTILSGKHQDVSDEDLFASFMKYIDTFEELAVRECLDRKFNPSESDVILSMLGQFMCHSKPTIDNLRSILLTVSRYVLLVQPFFALSEMRRGMLVAHPQLWTSCSHSLAESLVYHLRPTCQRVWDMFVEPDFRNVLERDGLWLLAQICVLLGMWWSGQVDEIHYWKSPMWIAVNFCDI